jgi:succinoglycan biosynthesis protein ExoM
MSDRRPTIEVLICTFQRPHLRKTLESLATQVLPSDVTIGVIVADNDDLPSASGLVEDVRRNFPHPLRYIHAPGRNISIARNACLEAAQSPWIAFLDDDEVTSPVWIGSLWRTVCSTGADAAFGPVLADYPTGTPPWLLRLDLHSTRPVLRSGEVETGYTGNALLRWLGAPWMALRFEVQRGVTGGEDTAFFFAARRMGARYAPAPDATVYEAVEPRRLTFGWLAHRRFRMGQTYVSSVSTMSARLALFLTALAKSLACGAAVLVCLPWAERRHFWALRGLLQMGVVAGCISQLQLHDVYYGRSRVPGSRGRAPSRSSAVPTERMSSPSLLARLRMRLSARGVVS